MTYDEFGNPIEEGFSEEDIESQLLDYGTEEEQDAKITEFINGLMGRNEDPRDFSNKYNTILDGEDEEGFKAWLERYSEQEGRDLSGDLFDYDLRGLYKESYGMLPEPGHGTDRYKKPNHPTFSNESIYEGVDGYAGGVWENGKFTVGESNMYTPEELNEYFKNAEPDVMLHDARVNSEQTSILKHLIDSDEGYAKIMSDAEALIAGERKGKKGWMEILREKSDLEGGDNIWIKSALQIAAGLIGTAAGIGVSAITGGAAAAPGGVIAWTSAGLVASGITGILAGMAANKAGIWVSEKENRNVQASILRLTANKYTDPDQREDDERLVANWSNEKRIDQMRGQPGFLGMTLETLLDSLPYIAEFTVGLGATRAIAKGAFSSAVKTGVAGKTGREMLESGVFKITADKADDILRFADDAMKNGKRFRTFDAAVASGIQTHFEKQGAAWMGTKAAQLAAVPATMAAIGAPRILNDLETKALDDIHLDDNGEITFGETTGGDYARAFASSYIETVTEMIGADIAKKVFMVPQIKKVFAGILKSIPEEKLIGKGSRAAIKKAWNSDAGKILSGRAAIMKDLYNISAVNNSFEEFTEEYVGMVANAVFNLDVDERGDATYAQNLLDKMFFPVTHAKESASMMLAFAALFFGVGVWRFRFE